jgi:type IV fimbrial biogenesis protein FimT
VLAVKPAPRAKRRGQGVSLIELMTVLAVAAVMLAVALPDMRQLIRHQQLKAAADDLFGALGLARSLAIARNARVHVVPLDSSGVDWSRGWVVFVDRDGDRRPGTGDEVIAQHGPLAGGIAIGTAFSSRQEPDYIAYNGAGRSCADSNSEAARWGTLSLFQGERTRRIKINMLGRARMCDPARDGASCEGAVAP